MTYKVFSKLYDEALEYNDIDLYISERGWQDWMDDYAAEDGDVTKITNILTNIYDMSDMDIGHIRDKTGLSINKFASLYNIPPRTLQDWIYNKNRTPDYVKKLIAYTLITEL